MNSSIATGFTASDLHPSYIRIDLTALEHNLQVIKQHIGSAKLMAVLKANAYGHGLVPCGRFLESCGVDYLGVARVEEGIELRKAGIRGPILVFGGIYYTQIGIFLENDLELTVSSISKLEVVAAEAKSKGLRAKVHLKIDTGMGRVGVRPETAPALIDKTIASSWVELRGIYTHLACAEDSEDRVTREQCRAFDGCLEYFRNKNIPMPIRHVANSAALIQYPFTHYDMVRPGLALYGVPSARNLVNKMKLRAVMSVHTSGVYVKVARAGQAVSYGHTWRAPKEGRMLTIPMGYADGLLRRLSNRGFVLVRNAEYPIVGNVCMDQCMVFVGDAEVANGDEAIIIGSQGKSCISALDIAEIAETVPHEVLTAFHERIPRRFIYKDSPWV